MSYGGINQSDISKSRDETTVEPEKKAKRTQRKRMQTIKTGTLKVKHKAMYKKVHARLNQINKTMKFETLFANNELLHQRHYAIST